MPVSLDQIREELLPGLYEYVMLGKTWIFSDTGEDIFLRKVYSAVPMKEAVLFVAAAKLASNPIVSRRFWDG